MRQTLLVGGGGLGMTGVAEALHLLPEQTAVFGSMRTVAGAALPLGRRLMLHFFLKSRPFMALKAVNGGQGSALSDKGQEQR